MNRFFHAAFGIAVPFALAAQLPAKPDSLHPTAADSARTKRLNAVTITAAPIGRAEPISATVVSATTIRMTPARNTYDLLRQTAGVEVHDQGQGPGFASDASVRGFSSDHSTDLALWIDGVPVNEPVNGHSEGYNDFSLLFPAGIQEIDVIHGPTSPLYGNFALAGAVNVRTIERMRGTELTLAGGSYGHGDVVLLSGFDHGARGGGVIGAHYQHDDGFRPNAHSDLTQLHARMVHDLAPGITVDAGVEAYGARWSSAGFLSEDQFARHEYSIVSNTADGGFHQRMQERVGLRVMRGNMLWRTTAYATQGRWQLYLTIPPAGGRFEGTGSQTEEEDGRHGYGATSALTWTMPSGDITVGMEGRWDRARYENYFTTARTRDSVQTLATARQQSAALFLQSYFDINDHLRFDIGARYDNLDTRSELPDANGLLTATSASHGVFSPKLGATVRLSPMFAIYANASTGFRSSDGVITDPTLAPITVRSYESGIKLDRGGVRASATLFAMDVSNEQTLNPLTGAASNGGSSRRTGLEFDLTAPLTPATTLTADWAILDAKYRSLTVAAGDANGPATVLDGLRVYNTAAYVGSAAVDVAPPKSWWRLRIAGNWIGSYSPFDEPGVLLGGYGLLHLSGSVRFHQSDITLGVRNALDRAYPELVAGHIVSPGQPRSAFVSTRVTF